MLNASIQFYGTSTIGEKGQIVIPAKAREAMEIKTGDDFIFFGHSHHKGHGAIHIVKASEINSVLEKMASFSQGIENFKAQIKKSRRAEPFSGQSSVL